jgi:hypothetical protein
VKPKEKPDTKPGVVKRANEVIAQKKRRESLSKKGIKGFSAELSVGTIEQIKAIKKHNGLNTNGEVITFLVDEHVLLKQ